MGFISGSAKPRDIVSILVEISPIYDLTDPADSRVPPSSGFLTGDSDGDLDQCRSLADYIRSQGYAGIVAPSSALPGAKNLIIYFDGLASAIPTLLEGPDRFTITADGRIRGA
jgi:hypothetical protein